MDTVLVLAFTGLGIGSLYFLLSSGLSLVFGLMNVLSLAHAAFLTVCAYASWLVVRETNGEDPTLGRLLLAIVLATLVGGLIALVTELVLLRPLYSRDHFDIVLVTLGLGFVLTALISGIWGHEERIIPLPDSLTSTTSIFGAPITNDRLMIIAVAVAVFLAIMLFLRHTRHGLIVRAGVENRDMVRALGIDVRHSFTLVFVLGGLLAGAGGALSGVYLRAISPATGEAFLIFAFIVLIIGGLGSVPGAFVAALGIGLIQQFANYYINGGAGDLLAVMLMALTVLVRPQGLFGREGRAV
ncbi:branched-chain amino acid ABC transporter permease [Aeromicrobium choanae]|uniref:Amino acid/amide ABC transporter membrane protein 1, HAAT family n=1 Tax=Aeromicrobium choanae TaxID=1736691 RepID=A0A1T4YWR5_9ACTN|nr:branched-chain amino acid ABC transporter permease [Aeromicrobium choanae]SKB06176.1 amino acid/amide ABC transporter membrane protein 1, HAAT family [Aeromicrobium choanae]